MALERYSLPQLYTHFPNPNATILSFVNESRPRLLMSFLYVRIYACLNNRPELVTSSLQGYARNALNLGDYSIVFN